MKRLILFLFIFLGTSTIMLSQTVDTIAKSDNDRIIVVSGGGARGAWGVGLVEYLMDKGIHYSSAFGTSTGSLMIPFILLGDTASLRIGYTGVTQSDIFNVNPFITSVVDGVVYSRPSFRNMIKRSIHGNKSLGDTYPLRDRIRNSISPAMYDSIKNKNFNLGVAVTDLSNDSVYIKYSRDCSYDDMCNWIWASANEPVWMTNYYNNGHFYVDGGVRDVIPIRQALDWAYDHNYTKLDVIVNNSQITCDPFPDIANEAEAKDLIDSIKKDQDDMKNMIAKTEPYDSSKAIVETNLQEPSFNWFATLVRLLEIYNQGTVENDIRVATLMNTLHSLEIECPNSRLTRDEDLSNGKPLDITIYFMPLDLAKTYRNELAFFPEQMNALLKAGRKGITDENNNPNVIKFHILNTHAKAHLFF